MKRYAEGVRRERPLWPQTAKLLRAWCIERQLDLHADAQVFINQRGLPLTRFGVRFIRTASGTAPPSIC